MAKKKRKEIPLNPFETFGFDFVNSSTIEDDIVYDEWGIPLDYHRIEFIPLRNAVPFPETPFPLPIDDQEIGDALKRAEAERKRVVLINRIDLPGSAFISGGFSYPGSLFTYGVVSKIGKIISLPDGKELAFMLPGERVIAENYYMMGDGSIIGKVKSCPEKLAKKDQDEFAMTVTLVEDTFDNFVQMLNSENGGGAMMMGMMGRDRNPIKSLNHMALHTPFDTEERLELLNESNLLTRAQKTLTFLKKNEEYMKLRQEIFRRAGEEISSIQKEQFLQSQLRVINEELNGGQNSDYENLRQRAEFMNWPAEVAEFFHKELSKLQRYNSNSPDYSIQYGYLDTILSLPWNKIAESSIDIPALREDLDREHYGLEKIKERIVEHIAVLKLRGDMRSPIICLYGPPGVGKTSLCKSIADSIDREYVRMSLGGLHDESEIRGHRKTYIGAMPGRIINGLLKCTTNNPVFVLDEIDKIGKDYKGDPAQALLEVLDPEQNSHFHDNYLDVDYDLSKIFFIATANTTSTISAPLLDRMELIDISGYIVEEKMEIAKRHLIPKLLVDHGFKAKEIKFKDDAIKLMIENYTRESGVRKLEKVIARVLRKLAVKKAAGEKYKKTLDAKVVQILLGKPEVMPEIYEGNDSIGVVTGLAWTSVGGEILYIESILSKGKGDLSLTGNLGDVMKESATIAMQWLKSNAEDLGLDPELFASKNVHIHVPEGAVPKDGPSAGITMVTSLASSFMGRKVRKGVAMTGEMTLRGKVLPVGGIKEKILAAKRAGITEIILSSQNQKDVEEIGDVYIDGLKFHYVDNIKQVISLALE